MENDQMDNEIKKHIKFLIDLEVSEEDKLDMLTAIGTQTSKLEIFNQCEQIRNEMRYPQ
jgi:hypothetical protein